jgi:hypothetical protein
MTTGGEKLDQSSLWALADPYAGGPVTGYKLAEYTLGQLVAG